MRTIHEEKTQSASKVQTCLNYVCTNQPYLDNLSPLVDLSYVGKVGLLDITPPLPDYQPDTLEAVQREDFIELTPRIAIIGKHNPTGRGYIHAVHKAGCRDNLKKGDRQNLQRTNLTSHAKRMIISAGDALQDMVEKKLIKYTVLVTLSYRKNVPDHKTAKKHLANWIRAMKKQGFCKYFAWVAQNQNGERAKMLGIDSYRSKHGEGIHFHMITSRISIEKARHSWRKIVHSWEKSEGLPIEAISGVDIQKVHNASRYIARYITTEDKAGSIQGNMWNISAPLRKLCTYTTTNPVTITAEEWKQYVKNRRINSKRHEVKQRNWSENVHTVKDWKGYPIVFFRDIEKAISDVYKFKNHLRKIEKILRDAKITTL